MPRVELLGRSSAVVKTPKMKSQWRSNMSGDGIKDFSVGSEGQNFVSVGCFGRRWVSVWFRTTNLLICEALSFASEDN